MWELNPNNQLLTDRDKNEAYLATNGKDMHVIYFTAGEKEVRAWTVREGTLAPQAAGEIHTDFERGFIRAEVIGYDEYIDAGGETEAKARGTMRVEGKDYVVQDGDVMHFRFNV